MDDVRLHLLKEVAGLHEIPTGAYSIRENGKTSAFNSTDDIDIVPMENGKGLDIYIKDGTKKKSLHMPVIISQSGVSEVVYNNFHVGNDCDVTIIAGCGIHNGGDAASKHDGIHAFFIGENSKLKYIEKHYGSGDGNGQRIMNPETIIEMAKNSYMEMDTVQIKGVDYTIRKTNAKLDDNAKLVVMERLMTHGKQTAESFFDVELNGKDCGANIISRSVAKEQSYQNFVSNLIGNNACNGHTECDAIIMDDARIAAVPSLEANHTDAALIHEAAIGKIAGEQIIKLMTLGLTEEEAEAKIVDGFLK